MKNYRLRVILFMLLATPPCLAETAEISCDRSLSFNECWMALEKQHLEVVAQEEQRNITKDVLEAETGSGLEPDSNAVRDLLTPFAAALGLKPVDGGKSIAAFEQRLLTFQKDELEFPVKFRVDVAEAELLESLKEALPEDVRADRSAVLEDDIDTFDDLSLQLHTALEKSGGKWWVGRRVALYQDIIDDLFEDSNSEQAIARRNELVAVWQSKLLSAIGRLGVADLRFLDISVDQLEEKLESALVKRASEGLGEEELKAQKAELEAQAEQEVKAILDEGYEQLDIAARDFAESFQLRQKKLRDNRFTDIAKLIENQPQAYVEINRRERGDLSGPGEWSARVVYEMGLVNVNSFLRWMDKVKGNDCTVTKPILPCLKGYLDSPGTNWEDRNRFAFSYQFVQTDSFAFALPDDGVDFRLEAIDKHIGSIAYGRGLSLGEKGEEASRLDVAVSYEDVSNDPARQSRWLADVTVSRQLVGDLSLSFGVQWANRPEYLLDEDGEQLGGRIALGWKVNGLSDSKIVR